LGVECGPLIEEAGWIFDDKRGEGIVVSAAED
jgi:hypothetical protein